LKCVLRAKREFSSAATTSNQLSPEQCREARMFGRPLFAAGHGYGVGLAVVTEPDQVDPLRPAAAARRAT
jgi:hypothetical protein